MAWKIFDFFDASGANALTAWLDRQDGRTRGRVQNRLFTIRNAGDQLPNTVTPTSERKILEIELDGKSGAFRVFLCRGPGSIELTCLGGGREKDTTYVRKKPHITPGDAEIRRAELMRDLVGRRYPHEFPEDNLG